MGKHSELNAMEDFEYILTQTEKERVKEIDTCLKPINRQIMEKKG